MLWKMLNQRLVESILRSGELDDERKSKCLLNLTQKVKKLTPFYTIFNVSRLYTSSQKCSRMAIMIRNIICDHFCEDAYGRDGHGHASESKETLYLKKKC